MMFDIKKFLMENTVTLNEVRPGSFTQLKADLANSMLTEQRHYKEFVKASKLSTSQMRISLRAMMVAQTQSAQIAKRLEDTLSTVEKK